jgi:D-xylose transport system substrate-binding protein
MRKATLVLAVIGLLAAGSMTACTDDGTGGGTGNGSGGKPGAGSGIGKIGVILPDTETSARWKTDDPKYLAQTFKAAGVPADIRNAEGDKAKFVSMGEQMINEGAKVLILANLDSPSGKAVIDKAKAAKVKTIDYDRLTLNGAADYYVSFDGVAVGRLQAQALIDCLTTQKVVNPVVAELNGSPTDNNATLFKQGYDSVLQPMYDEARYTKGPDQSVPDWVNAEGGKIFEQMWKQQPRIRGVLVANDGMAGAVIGVLKKAKMNGRVPVTGQDATLEGLQNILTGDQCMTVYKAIKPEAETAAKLAIALYRNTPINDAAIGQNIVRIKDPESGAYLPFVSLDPQTITKDNIQDVIDDNFVTKKALCAAKFAKLCAANGIK